jgi:hypothetical protein
MNTLAWGCTAAALCVIVGILIGWPIGHRRGWDHATEEAAWQRTEEAARPVPARAPAPPAETPRTGPGKHRHPAGPPKHAALPVAGYLPAPDGPWGGTITMPAQAPPWDRPPDRILHVRGVLRADEAARIKEVLEPTAVLSAPPPDPCTDSQFTRRMALDMDQWIREHIGATDSVLKEITGGAR